MTWGEHPMAILWNQHCTKNIHEKKRWKITMKSLNLQNHYEIPPSHYEKSLWNHIKSLWNHIRSPLNELNPNKIHHPMPQELQPESVALWYALLGRRTLLSQWGLVDFQRWWIWKTHVFQGNSVRISESMIIVVQFSNSYILYSYIWI